MTIRLNGQTSGYVELEAPATAGSNTLVLPDGNGTSGQYLQTNGSGTLSWNTVTTGMILQAVQVEKLDTSAFSVTSQDQWHDVFSCNITPTAANSRIHIAWYTSVSTAVQNQRGTFRLQRGSTSIGIGNADGNRLRGSHGSIKIMDIYYSQVVSQTFIDTPTYTLGNQLTYTLQTSFEQSASTIYINRSGQDDNSNVYHRGSSYMVLMEMAA